MTVPVPSMDSLGAAWPADPQQLDLDFLLANDVLDPSALPTLPSPLEQQWTGPSAAQQGPQMPAQLAARPPGRHASLSADAVPSAQWQLPSAGAGDLPAAMQADSCMASAFSPSSADAPGPQAAREQASASGRPADIAAPKWELDALMMAANTHRAADDTVQRQQEHNATSDCGAGRAPRRRTAETPRGGRGTVRLRGYQPSEGRQLGMQSMSLVILPDGNSRSLSCR